MLGINDKVGLTRNSTCRVSLWVTKEMSALLMLMGHLYTGRVGVVILVGVGELGGVDVSSGS